MFMALIVQTLAEINNLKAKYYITWISSGFENTATKTFDANFVQIAERIGGDNALIRGSDPTLLFEETRSKLAAIFLDMQWSIGPYLFITEKPITALLPEKDRLIRISFEKMADHPDEISKLFYNLARLMSGNASVFDELEKRDEKRVSFLEALIDSVSIAPSFHGFGIDIMKLIKNLWKGHLERKGNYRK